MASGLALAVYGLLLVPGVILVWRRPVAALYAWVLAGSVMRPREVLGAAKPITRVFVRERGRMVALPLEQVERLEACDDYVALHSGGRQHLVHARLQDLEARLDPRRFVRIHRSHVVNLDFVAAIEAHEGSRVVAVLKSGARIVASRPGTARLKARTSGSWNFPSGG